MASTQEVEMLRRQLDELTAQIIEVRQQSSSTSMNAAVSGLAEAVRTMGQSVSKPRPEDMRVGKPEPYAPGKDFDDWDFTFNGYAGTLDPAYPALLQTARQSPTVVMATPPHEQQSATLLYLLTMLTQKGARKVVRKAGNNGFEAYRQLCLMYGTSDLEGSTGLFVQIMTYKFGSKIEDVEDHLNEFLELVRSKPEVTGQAWEGLSGSKAKRRVLASVDPAPPQKRVRHTKDETSLNVKLTEEMQKAIDNCFRVLNELGYASPRYTRVKNPVKGQEESVMKLQTNAFIHNFSSPKGLTAARRKFETYLLAMRGLGVNPLAPEDWTLAAFITEQAQRGASVGNVRLSSAWGIESPLVQAQRSSWTLGTETRARKPAKTASLVRHMENLLFEAESNMMRCWAGVQCAMAHGCLRWADLQATKNLKLTKDAVFGGQLANEGQENPCAMGCAKGRVHWARLGFCLVVGACCCRPPR